MKCEICKKKIEESKPNFLAPILYFMIMIVIITFIVVIALIGIKGEEILSIGERLILFSIVFATALALIFVPNGADDLKKNYEFSYMKKYSFLKHFNKLYLLPYILIAIYFGLVIFSAGEIIIKSIFDLGIYSFAALWIIPLIIYTIEEIIIKRKKKW